jgi:hypothetical protein
MPDSFANADAVQHMPASEIDETLRELREALEKGDRETARELAEKLLETLSRWMASLEEAARGASQGEIDPSLQELMELESEVGDIAAEQEKLLQQTQSISREASDRAAEELQKEIESFLERQERRLQSINRSARGIEGVAPNRGIHGVRPPTAQARGVASPALELFEAGRRQRAALGEVRKALRDDLARAREAALTLDETVEALQDRVSEQLHEDDPRQEVANRHAEAAQQEIQGLLQDLDELLGSRLAGLKAGEAQQLGGLGESERGLAERTDAVAQRLRELTQRLPFLDPEMPGKAGSARDAMGEAAGELGRGNPFGAIPPETRALEDLADLAGKLEGARGQMQGGEGGPNFQIVRSPGNRSGGGRGVDRSPVEIPKEMEARELRAFREEVLKAMRSGRYPKDYEEEVERYFERLIR